MTDEEFKSSLADAFAKSTAEIASLAEENKETDRQLRAFKEQSAETERALKEMFAETDRKMAESSAETDRKIAKVSEQIDKVSKQMGGINENIGHHAEEFFQNVFADKKVFGGIKYDDIILNMKHKDKSGEVEFDIVLENGNAVALIEVKNRIHPDFVKKLAEERMARFRKHFPVYKSYDIYLGIAGFSFDNAVLEEARRYGVGIVRQAGDGIEVDATSLRAYKPELRLA